MKAVSGQLVANTCFYKAAGKQEVEVVTFKAIQEYFSSVPGTQCEAP